MRINWKKERANYDATIQTELDKLGISNLEHLKNFPQSKLEILTEEFEVKRNHYRYGGHYEAFDRLMMTCSSRLPIFNGGKNE
jgi:hypothetical protein